MMRDASAVRRLSLNTNVGKLSLAAPSSKWHRVWIFVTYITGKAALCGYDAIILAWQSVVRNLNQTKLLAWLHTLQCWS